MKPKPSMGRIVIFTAHEGCAPAMISEVADEDKGIVHLTVFPPHGGPRNERDVCYSNPPQRYSWRWPPT